MPSDSKRLQAARRFFGYLASHLDVGISIGLWDGSRIPRGGNSNPRLCIRIASPPVLEAIARRPTPENLAREYTQGGLSLEGGDLIAVGTALRERASKRDLSRLSKTRLLRLAPPFLHLVGRIKPTQGQRPPTVLVE